MRFSDVLERHIYYINFDPVEKSEFNGYHLGVVLKKNKDKRTVIVVPLTTSSNGEGVNEINLGKIQTLPVNLRDEDSWLVFDQVRTVNCNRFYSLKDHNRNRIQSPVNDELFNEIIYYCLGELEKSLTFEEKYDYYQSKYLEITMQKIINTAYEIKRLLKRGHETKEIELKKLQSTIVSLVTNDMGYINNIPRAHRDNGIIEIINKCLDNTILDFSAEKKIS